MPVVAINSEAKPAKIIPDELMFRSICDWKKLRCQFTHLHAEMDKITLGGLKEHEATDQLLSQANECADQMENIQAHIECWTPESVLTVRASITMVMDILAAHQAEPEGTLSGGDLIRLLHNSLTALETLDGKTPLVAQPLFPEKHDAALVA